MMCVPRKILRRREAHSEQQRKGIRTVKSTDLHALRKEMENHSQEEVTEVIKEQKCGKSPGVNNI
jgi:hypothetical protein